MTRRKLRPDEVELWRKVAATAERLHPETAGVGVPLPKPTPKKQPRTHMPLDLPVTFQPGPPPAHDLAPSVSERVARAPLAMDRKTHQKMKRGKLLPQGKLDLHGMTLDQAHPRLASFILSAQANGKRLVLVITGKGRTSPHDGPIPVRKGILRHQVPHWLSIPPLAQAVLQISEAHVKHGGGGAFYVYLRRPR